MDTYLELVLLTTKGLSFPLAVDGLGSVGHFGCLNLPGSTIVACGRTLLGELEPDKTK
jgi:hypothetical protein